MTFLHAILELYTWLPPIPKVLVTGIVGFFVLWTFAKVGKLLLDLIPIA